MKVRLVGLCWLAGVLAAMPVVTWAGDDEPKSRPQPAAKDDQPKDRPREEGEPALGPLRAKLQERMRQLQREVEELRERGGDAAREKVDSAKREMEALREKLGRLAPDAPLGLERRQQMIEKVRDLERRLAALLEEGRADAAEAVRRQLEEARAAVHRMTADESGPRRHFDGEPFHGPEQQLHHLRAAVGHLQAAGLADLAEAARRELERREQQLRNHPPRDADGPVREALQQTLQQMREEIQQLRRELQELRERRVERRADPPKDDKPRE